MGRQWGGGSGWQPFTAYPGVTTQTFYLPRNLHRQVEAKACTRVGFPLAEVIAPWGDNATFLAAQFTQCSLAVQRARS